MNAPRFRVPLGLLASGAIGWAAYRRGSLSRSGVVGAMLVGTTIFASGGAAPSTLLITFFVSSSVLSRWKRERKRIATSEFAKGERRDLAQVLANGGVAAALVALGRARPDTPWLPAFVGAIATVNADTWSTEAGTLSRQPPRLITTGKVVTAGTSGGATPLGTAAAALGAAAIGVVATLVGRPQRGDGSVVTPTFDGRAGALPLATTAGLVGAFVDSLLGATVQARYRCPACGVPTERTRHRCGTPAVLIGGWRAIDNDAVNFLSSLCGAAVGWWWGQRSRHAG
ncbi:MAG: hypothetical protein AVDCRST_MAG88-2086 [uncultured Thermomicrobiales bacterium]|uniref:DUF92 domain-containing protein n=1 Tax=uncultured Thermomicrobiales bacterium TaxID=1645740 RepID=A0A6J4V4E8_9BACT|nr:MAG: hypothetical protein AVDCRST_MAG88-2086 [uncultured Thermomicrobiales bacterium]